MLDNNKPDNKPQDMYVNKKLDYNVPVDFIVCFRIVYRYRGLSVDVEADPVLKKEGEDVKLRSWACVGCVTVCSASRPISFSCQCTPIPPSIPGYGCAPSRVTGERHPGLRVCAIPGYG